MARKQERKYISFELGKSQVVEENERILSRPITPQQTPVASPIEATEPAEATAPATAAAPIAQPQPEVQQPQVQQPQVQQPQIQQPQVQQPQIQQPQVQQPQVQQPQVQQPQVQQPQIQQPQVQQPQVQQPQVQQPQVQQPQPTAQASQPIGLQSSGNRPKRTEQGITVLVPMEYYQQIVLMKMRTGIPIRDIALQAVIEFVDKHRND